MVYASLDHLRRAQSSGLLDDRTVINVLDARTVHNLLDACAALNLTPGQFAP